MTPEPVEWVLVDAAIWTGDPANPTAEAMAVADGRIVYLGPTAGAPEGPRESLGGRTVLPGFVDAHVHLLDGGLEAMGCLLTDDDDAEVILQHVARCAAATPGRRWVVGSGWALPAFPDANPTAEALDAVTGRHPAFLLAADGHSAWLNSAALARLDPGPVDPPGGRIERDAEGRPTGVLREAAVDPAWELLPSPSARERREAILASQAEAHALGITGALEAWADVAALRAFRRSERSGELTLRLSLALDADPSAGPEQVAGFVDLRRRFGRGALTVSTAKAFVDGVLEARTAATIEPYVDTGTLAPPDWSGPALTALAEALRDEGMALHLHAIGDLAVRIGLDAAETGARVSIAHLEMIAPGDVGRFAALGVGAVFQPLWAWPDAYVRDLTWPGLSAEDGARLYPIAEVSRAGGPLAFGSDWSVSSMDPLDGIEVAVTRSDPDGVVAGTLGEGIGVEDAIRAYTVGSARVVGSGGPLVVGGPADFVVLDADPFAVAPERLSEIGVDRTVVGGRTVFRDGPPGGRTPPPPRSGGG